MPESDKDEECLPVYAVLHKMHLQAERAYRRAKAAAQKANTPVGTNPPSHFGSPEQLYLPKYFPALSTLIEAAAGYTVLARETGSRRLPEECYAEQTLLAEKLEQWRAQPSDRRGDWIALEHDVWLRRNSVPSIEVLLIPDLDAFDAGGIQLYSISGDKTLVLDGTTRVSNYDWPEDLKQAFGYSNITQLPRLQAAAG